MTNSQLCEAHYRDWYASGEYKRVLEIGASGGDHHRAWVAFCDWMYRVQKEAI